MRARSAAAVVAVVAAAALTGAALEARQAPPRPQGPGQPRVEGQRPAPPAGQRAGMRNPGRAAGDRLANPETLNAPEIERLFDTFVLFQAQEQLRLTDGQFLAFGQRLQRLQDLRRGVQRQRLQLLRELREFAQAVPLDEVALTAKLRELDEVHLRAAPGIGQAMAGIDQLLTPRQRVQFRVFEEQMEKRKLELLARARRQDPGR